jgi:hypothetical protein
VFQPGALDTAKHRRIQTAWPRIVPGTHAELWASIIHRGTLHRYKSEMDAP